MSGPHSFGDMVGGRYRVQKYVGEGGMQFVYAAEDQVLKRIVALKTPKNRSAERRFHRSAIVSARVNHPNVAKTLDYIDSEERPYLVEEFIDGTDLDKALLKKTRCLDPYLAARLLHYLAKGLAASHHVGVVHRDLKPTNVMVVGEFALRSVKITDFGIAKMADEEIAEAVEGGDASITSSQTAIGALPYMAPEVIESPRDVGTAADIWSIGAMMYELMTGDKPFGSGYRAVGRILEAKPPVFPNFLTSNPQFSALSRQIIDIVLKCLIREPGRRPASDEIVRLCGNLCYPAAVRHFGRIRTIRYRAWGFIYTQEGDVFFHMASVYGERPAEGDRVMLSKYPGGGASRAHPVVKLYEK